MQRAKALLDRLCEKPRFAGSAEETYYQVMFESPDGILLEPPL